jgi:hypothetical protein
MQNCISDKWLKLVVKNNLVDQYKQTWSLYDSGEIFD